MLLTAAVRHTSALPPPVRYDSGPPTAATCNRLGCDVTENPALMCAPTPQGPVYYAQNLQGVSSLATSSATSHHIWLAFFVYVTSHRIRLAWHVRQAFDSCEETGDSITRVQNVNSDRVTYKRRAAMKRSPKTSDASIVRTALRSTKKSVSRLNLSATRRDLTDAYATRRPSSFARGAVLRKGLHGDSLQREKARNSLIRYEIASTSFTYRPTPLSHRSLHGWLCMEARLAARGLFSACPGEGVTLAWRLFARERTRLRPLP